MTQNYFSNSCIMMCLSSKLIISAEILFSSSFFLDTITISPDAINDVIGILQRVVLMASQSHFAGEYSVICI